MVDASTHPLAFTHSDRIGCAASGAIALRDSADFQFNDAHFHLTNYVDHIRRVLETFHVHRAGAEARIAVSTAAGRCEGVGMRNRVGIAVLGSALASAALGCTSHVGKLTILSTRNVEMSEKHDRLPRAEESDSRLWLAFIPLGGAPSGLRAATDMIEEQNADYLTNVEVTEGGWSLIAISMGWVTVEADPWRRSGVAAPRDSSDD